MRCPLLLYFLFFVFNAHAQRTSTLNGFVKEKGSGELLPGIAVYLPGTSYGTFTNSYGFYSLTLPAADSIEVFFTAVAFQPQSRVIAFQTNVELNMELIAGTELEEVVITDKSQKTQESQTPLMSKLEIPVAQVKKIPAFLGEKDVLKVLQLMPGVQKGSEGQSGLYVRGGGPDQNLILLDEAIVYNANHLFGFFSIFNSDALKSVELTKGGFPARFGGRLSSVLEMNMKEGSKEKLQGEGGIGLIASRLTLEGPLKKDRSSFLVSGRRTYIDILARPFLAREMRRQEEQVMPGYYFYDLNAKVNYDFGPRNKLYLSGYFGKDRFYVREKGSDSQHHMGLNWGNTTATLRWNHLISPKLFANTSLIFSNFNFGISNYSLEDARTESPREFSLRYNSLIKDVGIKADFDYFPRTGHAVKFGMQVIRHRFIPSALTVSGAFTDLPITQRVIPIDTYESGIYIEDTWQAGERLRLNTGIRLSHFRTDSAAYLRPEPRVSAAFELAPRLAFKASFAQMNQYVHLLSNTGLGLPTDLWVPTTGKIRPQQSRQVAAGFAKDFLSPALTITLEGYHKHMDHILNYKEGASFLSIEGEGANELSWENNVTSGKGWSYGTELLIQRKSGKLSGWVGYTLSWTYWKFPELNFGKTFFPRYDRRHDISVVGMYQLTDRIHLSAVWVYGTGNALTLPLASYHAVRHDPRSADYLNRWGVFVNEYGEKNGFRAEPYHRLDFSIQFVRKKKRFERSWDISAYNVYNRRNPFFYNIDVEGDPRNGTDRHVLKRYSLFPIIPSISYSFKF